MSLVYQKSVGETFGVWLAHEVIITVIGSVESEEGRAITTGLLRPGGSWEDVVLSDRLSINRWD